MKKIIITVGHEYCSGGREIGKEIAKRLEIKYYDSEIIVMNVGYASMECRVERAIKEQNINRNEAKKLLHQIDKKRSQHYNAYTDQVWGSRGTYDMLVDSSMFGIEGTRIP